MTLKIMAIETFLSAIFLRRSNTPQEFIDKLLSVDVELIIPATGKKEGVFESVRFSRVDSLPDELIKNLPFFRYSSKEKELGVFAAVPGNGVVLLEIVLSNRLAGLKSRAGEKFGAFLCKKLEIAALNWGPKELRSLPQRK